MISSDSRNTGERRLKPGRKGSVLRSELAHRVRESDCDCASVIPQVRYHSFEWYHSLVQESAPLLTEQQSRVVAVFRRCAEDGSPPPTHRDLCREFGWGSTATARDHIKALVRKGVLSGAGHRARSQRLLGSRASGRLLPIVGRIVAGALTSSEEQIEGEMLVPREFIPKGPAFILRVRGDSMEGLGILNDDLVVVRKTETAQLGDVVAVTIDGESTLKLLQQFKGDWVLLAANPKYAPIEIKSPAAVHGVATAVMRVLENTGNRLEFKASLLRGVS
jgi:repressor LexA